MIDAVAPTKNRNHVSLNQLIRCVCVFVFVIQTHATILHFSIFIQRSFPQGLFEWSIWDRPQLETSYQPAVVDVS